MSNHYYSDIVPSEKEKRKLAIDAVSPELERLEALVRAQIVRIDGLVGGVKALLAEVEKLKKPHSHRYVPPPTYGGR